MTALSGSGHPTRASEVAGTRQAGLLTGLADGLTEGLGQLGDE